MPTTPQYHRLLERTKKIAQKEAAILLKSLPKDFKERLAGVPKVSIRFEDRPSRDRNDHSAIPEPYSVTNREAREIVIYVMPLLEAHAREPGTFQVALRRVIVKELGDWVGIDATTEE